MWDKMILSFPEMICHYNYLIIIYFIMWLFNMMKSKEIWFYLVNKGSK